MNAPLLGCYRDRIAGVLSCYHRIVITGTLPGACHHARMTIFLNAQHIRIFDYLRFVEPLRERIRGVRRADLQPFLPHRSAASITRYLKRLRDFGLIKKVAATYRYHLTHIGRSAIAACRLAEQTIVPALAG